MVAIIPTRRLVVVVIALSPLWLVSDAVAAYALLALAVVVLVDMLLLPARWQIRAQRIVPANVGLGDQERGEYRVGSRASRVLRCALFDALPRTIESPEPRGAVHTLAPNAETIIPFTFVARERGTWA